MTGVFRRITSSFGRDGERRRREGGSDRHAKKSDGYRRITTIADAESGAQADALTPAGGLPALDAAGDAESAAELWQRLSPLVYEIWRDFFRAFRDDEKHFEREDYLREALDIHAVLYAGGARHLPDAKLGEEMLRRLQRFQRQRFHDHRSRHETITGELTQTQQRETERSLTATFHRDELSHTRNVLLAAAAQHAVDLADLGDDPPAWRIAERVLALIDSPADAEPQPPAVPLDPESDTIDGDTLFGGSGA